MTRELLLIVVGLYAQILYWAWPLSTQRFWLVAVTAVFMGWASFTAGMSRRF